MIPGFVLAGGASRRMGRDKALLPFEGEPMAARIARVLGEGGAGMVHVVGNQPGLAELGLLVLNEGAHEGHHPLFGVAAALFATVGPLALLAPCDLPWLPAEAIRRLLAVGGPVVAEAAGRIHPLLAVLPTSLGEAALERALAGGSGQGLVVHLPKLALPPEWLRNANRPEDLQRG